MQAVVDSFRGGSGAGEDRDVAGARAAFEEAVRLYSGGDREAAKRALQRSIELLPLNPRAHLELGRVELELGQAAAAEGSLRTAIAIGEARSIDVEEAYPILVRALGEQGALPEKLRAVADEYLARYPSGRFRDGLAKLR
jgi:predicted Zn-dependent protease